MDGEVILMRTVAKKLGVLLLVAAPVVLLIVETAPPLRK
jgi:hypothetical protein